MNVPKPRKLSSGNYFIQMRLGGESVSVTAPTSKECIREASYKKAEYLAGKRIPTKAPEKLDPVLSLNDAIKEYCESKSNILSPATIRGYHNIRKNQLKSIMDKNVYDLVKLDDEAWQKIVNEESAKYSAKTVKNSISFCKTIIQQRTKQTLAKFDLESPDVRTSNFLMPEEIKTFVKAVLETDIALIALLALSSMRLSEIQALDWKYIKKNPDFIKTNGAVVPDENHQYQHKEKNKNATSTRNVPILIPELSEIIEQQRKPSGPLMTCSRSHFLKHVHRTCQRAGITDVDIHGLRHSFASLAYHLKMPEKIAMEIGGWADAATMHKIYTHIAQQDILRYQTEMAAFYKNEISKNANKNANETANH